jgi:hypothetical protein
LVIKRKRASGRAPELPAYQIETADNSGEHADGGEADQNRPEQSKEDYSGEAQDQQGACTQAERLGLRERAVVAARDDRHPQMLLRLIPTCRMHHKRFVLARR